MPFTSFHDYFPEIAKQETRTMTVLRYDSSVPKGSYGLLEMYCDDPGCDCRRVFLEVFDWEKQKSMAFIAYGWESVEFYRRWWKGDDIETIRELQGPILNDGSPHSEYAPAFLELVRNIILQDRGYIARLKRHYKMFKEKVNSRYFNPSKAANEPASDKSVPDEPKSKKRQRHRSSANQKPKYPSGTML